jgi:hypothetical protein
MMIEQGVSFITAAEAIGLRPDSLRRHLRKPEVVGFLRRESSRFRTGVCAANVAVLQDIRDNALNSMSRVAAVRELERQGEVASMQRPGEPVTPGITIKFVTLSPPTPTVDITPPKVIDAGE